MEYVIIAAVIVFIIWAFFLGSNKKPEDGYAKDPVKKAISRHQRKEDSKANKEVKEFNQPVTPFVATQMEGTSKPEDEPTPVRTVTGEFSPAEETDVEEKIDVVDDKIEVNVEPEPEADLEDPAIALGEAVEEPPVVPEPVQKDMKEIFHNIRFDLELYDVKEDVFYPKGVVIKLRSRKWLNDKDQLVIEHTAHEILEAVRSKQKYKAERNLAPLVNFAGSSDFEEQVLATAVKAVVEHFEYFGVSVEEIYRLALPQHRINKFD